MVKYSTYCIRSVPHTGTRFLSRLLDTHGIQLPDYHFWEFLPEDLIAGYPGLKICPIRDPKMVYVTWASKKGKVMSMYYTAWALFNELYMSGEEVFVLPIDTPDREEHLKALSKRLEVDLKTDWTPVGSEPRLQVEIPDLSGIYRLDVVKKFYSKE